MSVTSKPLSTANYLPASNTALYTAGTGTRTIIDKCTAYNIDSGTQNVTFNLVPNGGSAGPAQQRQAGDTLAAGETYPFPEIVGHVLEAGGVLSGIAATANKIIVRVSGREVV